jgi:hypothetical protein
MSHTEEVLDFDDFGSDLEQVFSPRPQDKDQDQDQFREVIGSGADVPMDTVDSLIDLPVPSPLEEEVIVKTSPFVLTEKGHIERTIDTRAFGPIYHCALTDFLKVHAEFAHHEKANKKVAWSPAMMENKMNEVKRKSMKAYDNLIRALFLDRNVKDKSVKEARISPAVVTPPEPETCACNAIHLAITKCPNANRHVALCECVTQQHKRDLPFVVPKKTFEQAVAERKALLPTPTPTATSVREGRSRWANRGRGGKRNRSASSTRQPPKPQQHQNQPQPSTSGYRPKAKRGRHIFYQDTLPRPQQQQQTQQSVPFRPPQAQIDFFKNLMSGAGDIRLRTPGHNLQTKTVDLSNKPAEAVSKPPDTAESVSVPAPVNKPARRVSFGQLPPMPANLPTHLSCETQENEDGSWVMMFYPNKKK